MAMFFSIKIFFLLLFKYSFLPFPPTSPPHPSHPHLPSLIPLLFGFVHVSFIVHKPFPLFPLLSPPISLLVTVRLFLISMSLVVFCLLVCFIDQVPVKGEVIWYLSLTAWLISLSIMFSSSIHAVSKGRSYFLLSATQYSTM